jgi:hypothetical protein
MGKRGTVGFFRSWRKRKTGLKGQLRAVYGLLVGGTLGYDKLQGYDTENKEGDGLGVSPVAAFTMMVLFLSIPSRGDLKVCLEKHEREMEVNIK